MGSLSGLRVAIYARHSTHMQAGPAEEQIDRCITLVEQQGGVVADIYRDEAKTGATTAHREGINRLVSDADNKRFDAVFFESLSRLVRDIADVATVFRKLTSAGIAIHSVTEGRVTGLHIGLKGAINALYLKELGDKSRRGLRTSVKRGRVLTYPYGYERTLTFDGAGNQITGQAQINAAEAAIVRRIYEEFASGKLATEIVHGLNRDGIPSPSGGKWSTAALYGARSRRDGILRRPIYAGNYVWGRSTYPTDPRTGKKVRQPHTSTEWEILEVPHLGIIERKLWAKVQNRLGHRAPSRPAPQKRTRQRPSHLHVTSGIIWCARCGGRLTTVWGGTLRCDGRQMHCDQVFQIPRQVIIRRVLRVLRMRLRGHHHPLLRLIEEEHEKRRADNAAKAAKRNKIEALVANRREKLTRLLDLVEDGTGGDEARSRIRNHEKRLHADLRVLDDLPPRAESRAAQNVIAIEERARGRLLDAICHLLDVDFDDKLAIGMVRKALAKIEAAYRGPGRTRLRATPHLDPAGIYDLGQTAPGSH